jgi:hypothetical protein
MVVERVEVAHKPASPPLTRSGCDPVVVLGEEALSFYHLQCQHQQLADPGRSP